MVPKMEMGRDKKELAKQVRVGSVVLMMLARFGASFVNQKTIENVLKNDAFSEHRFVRLLYPPKQPKQPEQARAVYLSINLFI